MTANPIHERGVAQARKQPTAILAQSFQMTEEILSGPPVLSLEHAELAIARGWIMEVLEERGELAAIGLADDYTPLAAC